MQIDKDQVLELIRSQGQGDKADQAAQELPDKVDPDQHGDLLSKYGVNAGDLAGKIPGLGGLGG